jgi:lysozyme
MKFSDAGLAKIAKSEGFSAKLYSDHKGRSIGHGHLCSPAEVIEYKDGISATRAWTLLRQDASRAESAVNAMVRRGLTQDEFDALVDFTYNLGLGNLAHIAANLNAGKPLEAVIAEMEEYDKDREGGRLVENPGLKARREEEAKAFMEPDDLGE